MAMLFRFNTESRGAGQRPKWRNNATIAVIALLCVVVVGHSLTRTWQDRTRQLQSAQREVANLSWAVGEHAEAAFLLAESVLDGLNERAMNDGTGPEQRPRLSEVMKERVARLPVLNSLSVVDPDGIIIADSRPETVGFNAAQREFFQYQQTHDDHRPRVSNVIHSRVSGKPIISISIRLNRPGGGFAGVLVATVGVAYFEDFYATLNLGRDGIAGLFRQEGILLVRHPSFGSEVGSNLSGGALFRDALPAAASGTFVNYSAIDGVNRIVGYRRLTGFPLVVAAGLGVEEQLAAWRISAGENLLASVLIALLLGYIGVRLVLQVRWLTRAELATKAAEAEARTAAERFRMIANNASDVVITIDMQFVRRYVSPGCRDLLGYEPEELIGGSPLSLTHPEEIERIGECLREMIAGRDRDLITCRVRHRDGHWIWMEVSFRLVRDPNTGKPREICAALRDLTERMAAESALRESASELEQFSANLQEMQARNAASQYARSLLEASLDPMVTISPEGKITDVNEATIRLTGVPRDGLIGTDFSDYFTEPALARIVYRQVFAVGSARDFALTIKHPDQPPTDVLYNASVYRDEDGNVLGVFAAARDITAVKRAEAEVAAQRRKELDRLEELELYQRLTVGRELKMIDLKKEILDLQEKIAAAAG
jgi:PAS domain S-box-containing protein